MEEQLLFLILGLWLLCTARRRFVFQRRLTAARQNTAAKYRRVWELLREIPDDEMTLVSQRRRRRILHSLLGRRQRPYVWALDRAAEWWDVIVPGFTPSQWVQNFRMSEETFLYVCNKMQPAMERQNTSFRNCVPLKKRLAVALWKLATGSEYRTVGHLFGVSTTTVCRCVQEFCAAANTFLVPEHICFPSEEKLAEMASFNESNWGLPQCVGSINRSHIPILAPKEYHGDYINCKGWHSIILQGVVDGRGLFWNIFAGLPGSLDDARVLRLSTLWDLASCDSHFTAHTKNIGGVNVGYYILGDSAYPLQNWLLTPFPDTGSLTGEQRIYNKKICRARVVVENAFGRLKGRWNCLTKRNDCDIELVKSMVLTCCALHNLCESQGEAYDDAWDAAAVAAEPLVAVGQDADDDDEEEGREVREGLMRYLNV